MKKLSLKVLTVFLSALVLLGSSLFGAGALSFPNNVKTQSKSILLVSMDTGQTVYEKNADEKMYPASTTKIMTFIVAYEHIDDIQNTRITIKKSIIDKLRNTGSSMAYLSDHIGKKVSVTDILYSLIVPSGNDAAMVLADYVGNGDIDAFVEMMNDKAEELGCENTHFANPDGLHNKNHYTTARDLVKITNYALTLDGFEKIAKPDPKFYRLLEERFDVNLSECLFIDDREKNIAGAEAVGMKGLLFTGYEKLLQDLEALGIKVN